MYNVICSFFSYFVFIPVMNIGRELVPRYTVNRLMDAWFDFVYSFKEYWSQ